MSNNKKSPKKKRIKRSSIEKKTQTSIESLFSRSGILTNRVNSGSFTGATGVRVRCNSILGKSDLEAWFKLKNKDDSKMSIGVCLYMEIKSPTGRQSPNQKKFQNKIEERSQKYVIVRTLEESVAAVMLWKAELEQSYPDLTLEIGKLDRFRFKGE